MFVFGYFRCAIGSLSVGIAAALVGLLTCVAQHATFCYMIKHFRHKGLKLFFEKGKTSGIQKKHQKRLTMQLAALNTATKIDDMDIPGYSLHLLKGKKKDFWSITVNKNWRLTFQFCDGDVYILNYEDYH